MQKCSSKLCRLPTHTETPSPVQVHPSITRTGGGALWPLSCSHFPLPTGSLLPSAREGARRPGMGKGRLAGKAWRLFQGQSSLCRVPSLQEMVSCCVCWAKNYLGCPQSPRPSLGGGGREVSARPVPFPCSPVPAAGQLVLSLQSKEASAG